MNPSWWWLAPALWHKCHNERSWIITTATYRHNDQRVPTESTTTTSVSHFHSELLHGPSGRHMGGRFWQSDSGAWISTIDKFGFPQLAILDFHNRRLSIHYCAACVKLLLDFTICHQVQQHYWLVDHHRQHPAQCQINVKIGLLTGISLLGKGSIHVDP